MGFPPHQSRPLHAAMFAALGDQYGIPNAGPTLDPRTSKAAGLPPALLIQVMPLPRRGAKSQGMWGPPPAPGPGAGPTSHRCGQGRVVSSRRPGTTRNTEFLLFHRQTVACRKVANVVQCSSDVGSKVQLCAVVSSSAVQCSGAQEEAQRVTRSGSTY